MTAPTGYFPDVLRTWLRARQERIDAEVEAHQQRLIARGSMCPSCRHSTDGANGASRTAGVCGDEDSATVWGGNVCPCNHLWHGR